MKYSKELHERVRQNLRMFDYPRFDDGDIDALLDEIERLQALSIWIPVSEPPKEKGNYLLSDGENVIEESWSGNEWGCSGGKYWQPKPEPPEDK